MNTNAYQTVTFRWTLLVAGMCAVLFAWPVFAQGTAITTEPQSLTVTGYDQSHTVKLTIAGQPVPASAIQSASLMVDNHDYRHMIQMQKADGQVTITPSPALEQGTYTLVIHTTRGQAAIPFAAPLFDMDRILQSEAERRGVTVEQLRLSLGISEKPARHRISLGIPAVYYEGQSLNITLNPEPGRRYVWRVNGETAKEGTGTHSFSYTFRTPGVYNFHYQEFHNGSVIAEDSQVVSVNEQPAVDWEVRAGTEFSLAAPPGFGKYLWTVDGQPAAHQATLRHTFDSPGQHQVILMAEEPHQKDDGIFRKIRYNIRVLPRNS